jgi:hypothetical protein
MKQQQQQKNVISFDYNDIVQKFMTFSRTKNVSVTNEGKVHVGGIDRDIMGKNNKLMFAIEATDNGHQSRSGIAYITLIVNGTNDNKPEFPDNENNVSVILKENLQLYPSIYQSKVRNECNSIYKYITRI